MIKTINNYIDAMGKAMLHLGTCVDKWKNNKGIKI